MDAHRLIYIPFYGVNVAFGTFYTLLIAISRSNSRSRRTLIHAQRASACILCLISPRYLVLLFLVWKQYWKIVASTLFRLLRFSNGTDSTSFLAWALSICSLPKYLQVFLPFLLMTENLPFVVLDRHGVNDLTSMLVGNFKCCGIGLLKFKAWGVAL